MMLVSNMNTKEINIRIKEDMKFDAIIANPPYNNSMDLKFLDKSIDLMSENGEIVFVHPSTWLIDEKLISKKFNDIRTKVEPYLDSVKIFNANKLFGVALSVPCIISHFRKENIYSVIKVEDEINNVKIEYDNIWQINKFSNNKEYLTIKDKVKHKPTLNDFYNKDLGGNYYVNISRIRGHVNVRGSGNEMIKDDFYSTVTKDEVVTSDITKKIFFNFKTEDEASNFLLYLKTFFSRYCLSIFKTGLNIRNELKSIPYLDFTKEWPDEKLYKHFNITKEEQEFINKNIPEYY